MMGWCVFEVWVEKMLMVNTLRNWKGKEMKNISRKDRHHFLPFYSDRSPFKGRMMVDERKKIQEKKREKERKRKRVEEGKGNKKLFNTLFSSEGKMFIPSLSLSHFCLPFSYLPEISKFLSSGKLLTLINSLLLNTREEREEMIVGMITRCVETIYWWKMILLLIIIIFHFFFSFLLSHFFFFISSLFFSLSHLSLFSSSCFTSSSIVTWILVIHKTLYWTQKDVNLEVFIFECSKNNDSLRIIISYLIGTYSSFHSISLFLPTFLFFLFLSSFRS